MEASIVFSKIRCRQPIAYHHICLSIQHSITHGEGLFGGISIIAIYHQITFRINISEHGAHHITLPLPAFNLHDSAMFYCNGRRTVC